MKCNLKGILKRKKFTYKLLAECMDVTPETVYRWCNGLGFPSSNKFDDLCGLLEVTLGELFTLEPTEWVEVEEVA